MSEPASIRCLILACGNTLRGDDGIGPHLAAWAEELFSQDADVRVIARQQWTPELAAEIAEAESLLFVDCSIDAQPGSVALRAVAPAAAEPALATHHIGAAELLALARELYGARPRQAMLLTIGAGSTELGETFTAAMMDSLPQARELIEQTLHDWLR